MFFELGYDFVMTMTVWCPVGHLVYRPEPQCSCCVGLQTAAAVMRVRVSGFPAGRAVAGEFFSSQCECVEQDCAVQV